MANRTWAQELLALVFLCCYVAMANQPEIKVHSAIKLREAPYHENLGTKNQAMNVWKWGSGSSARELVVGLMHQYNDLDRRADDKEFAVAWESDGSKLTEVMRVPMTCPNVELVVPEKGPYVFEARLDLVPGTLHPECSCSPQQTSPCPNGIKVTRTISGTAWTLKSPTQTHFVQLQNEWGELIADNGVLGRLTQEYDAPVAVVSRAIPGALTNASGQIDPAYGCPGTRDDEFGNEDVTYDQLEARGLKLPAGHVTNSWCLVKRGVCSETAKVKVCESSGAIGTIIVDHGMFIGDQEVKVKYRRAAGERASKPVLFISYAEGTALAAEVTASGASVEVGPSIAGLPPEGYQPGSGIIVHTMGPSLSAHQNKSYPNLFATAGWLEASSTRDLLFVCLPALGEVRIFDISDPLNNMPVLGVIPIRCSRWGLHDYRVLDYRGVDGQHRTLLVDPADRGNRLYYYNTENPANPKLELEIHAKFEAETDGLGQVRPGGPQGRYHVMTWHCSDLYCGKSHGDNIYFLDSWNLTTPAVKVPLPMLTKGSYARDISCGADGVCLVSLTWDGFVALDSGVAGTVNKLSVVASHVGEHPFSTSYVPLSQAHLRMYSGAQKVYSSAIFPRHFYVEHADFNLRPLRMGDVIRALQMNEIYLAEVRGYNESVKAESPSPQVAGGTIIRAQDLGSRSSDQEAALAINEGQARSEEESLNQAEGKVDIPLVGVLAACTAFAFVLVAVLLMLLFMRLKSDRQRQAELDAIRAAAAPSAAAGDSSNDNVVVGRPIAGTKEFCPDDSKAHNGEALGHPPSVVHAPSRGKLMEDV